MISFADIARKFGIRGCVVNATVKRLERKNIIEVKQSFALFGTMNARGVKILKEM